MTGKVWPGQPAPAGGHGDTRLAPGADAPPEAHGTRGTSRQWVPPGLFLTNVVAQAGKKKLHHMQ